MKQIKVNPSNRRYYSIDFMTGFECGTKTQFEANKKVIDKIKKARNEVANYSDFHREHLYKTNPNYDVEQGQYSAYKKCLQIIDDLIAEVEE